MLGGPQSPVAWDLQGRSGLLDKGTMGLLPIPERRVTFAAVPLGHGVDAFHGHHEAGKEHLGTIILSELKFERILIVRRDSGGQAPHSVEHMELMKGLRHRDMTHNVTVSFQRPYQAPNNFPAFLSVSSIPLHPSFYFCTLLLRADWPSSLSGFLRVRPSAG